MDPKEILVIVRREMMAYAAGWRRDWLGFDGKTLRNQIIRLNDWAETALAGETVEEYHLGSLFLAKVKGEAL